jgi:aryl-alcohol dehydrogenase-like predicted oxidoreductase
MINWKPENEEVDFQIIKRAIEHGINFFDTAENYAAG